MDVIEAIHTRRSIRDFDEKPVTDEVLHDLLAAAMTAPSAGNSQPWHYVVINDRSLLDTLSEVHPYVGMLKKAPAAILVCADPGLEKFPGYWVVDCSAAVQNLLLAAHGLGLGAVWTGVYPQEERMQKIAEILQLPQGIQPHSLIPLGYTSKKGEKKDRFKKDRIHINGW